MMTAEYEVLTSGKDKESRVENLHAAPARMKQNNDCVIDTRHVW